MNHERCPGCGVDLPPVAGPVHRHIESSPSWWAAYGQVLAREYSGRAYWSAHRITADAYAGQYPGCPLRESNSGTGVVLMNVGGHTTNTGVQRDV